MRKCIYMKNRIVNLIKILSFAVFLFIMAMLAVLWAYCFKKNNEIPAGNTKSSEIKVSADIVTSPVDETKMNPVTSVSSSISRTSATTSTSTKVTSSAVVSTAVVMEQIISSES